MPTGFLLVWFLFLRESAPQNDLHELILGDGDGFFPARLEIFEGKYEKEKRLFEDEKRKRLVDI